MKRRLISIALVAVLILSLVPINVFAEDQSDVTTIYVLEDVYGAPGETVGIKIGFKNSQGKNIQQFQAILDVGDCQIVEDITLQLTPQYEGVGFGFTNNSSNKGAFGFACGKGSFSIDTYATVYVTIPESANWGDTYPITISKDAKFSDVLKWEDNVSAEGDVVFEGATLRVEQYAPVITTVKDVNVSVGDTRIHVPVVMTGTNGKLASCTELSFSVSGSAAQKVKIDAEASKEFKIQGMNEKYTVLIPDTESEMFALGFASGYDNAIIPTETEFQIFELVFNVTEPLNPGDTFTVEPVGDNPFVLYDGSATDIYTLCVAEYISGSVTVGNLYEWEVIDEIAATAKLLRYTGDAPSLIVPSAVVGNGVVGTDGKQYSIIELDGSENGGVFYENDNLQSVEIPGSVQRVGINAFYGCTELKLVILNSVEVAQSIVSLTAAGSLVASAQTVVIPDSVDESAVGTYITEHFTEVQLLEISDSFGKASLCRVYSVHSHGEEAMTWSEVDADNCTKFCKECELVCISHLYGDWYEISAPTCIEKGTQQRDCTRCNHSQIDDLKELGHELTQHPGKEATCDEGGWQAYETCSRCDYTTYEEIG
ncbi:MAG: hypothetical protein E7616_06725, partial [Ruminococcaceae bacterium]|nr:hypothetical protein [Oscillospiraceae bacterium]